jgi:5-methylcytosine-specific restriction endonuclease McrA
MPKGIYPKNQAKKDTRITIACEACGKLFEKSPSAAKKYVHHYCSPSCYYKNHKLPQGMGKPGTLFACDYCGKTQVSKRGIRLNRNVHNFCDRTCYVTWNRERHKGEKSPLYLGPNTGYRKFGRQWYRLRTQLLIERGERCEVCSKPTKGQGLHLHHKISRRQGGAMFDPQNLIFLCRTCHHRETFQEIKAMKEPSFS